MHCADRVAQAAQLLGGRLNDTALVELIGWPDALSALLTEICDNTRERICPPTTSCQSRMLAVWRSIFHDNSSPSFSLEIGLFGHFKRDIDFQIRSPMRL